MSHTFSQLIVVKATTDFSCSTFPINNTKYLNRHHFMTLNIKGTLQSLPLKKTSIELDVDARKPNN